MTNTLGPFRTDVRPWQYRRSLASRVILLTTIAVGLAVAFVSIGAYVTVRMQLQSSLDDYLLDRAHDAAEYPALKKLPTNYEVPSWALGAADIRIMFVTSDHSYYAPDRGPLLRLGEPELDVAAGAGRLQHPHHLRGGHPLPGGERARSGRARPWCWPSPWSPRNAP